MWQRIPPVNTYCHENNAGKAVDHSAMGATWRSQPKSPSIPQNWRHWGRHNLRPSAYGATQKNRNLLVIQITN
jgi:hypothetical protein